MKNKQAFVFLFAVLWNLNMFAQNKDENYYRDLYPDTWMATDALGRQMPDQEQVGPVKNDKRRVVGIFYITWHSDDLAKLPGPYTSDVTKILTKDTGARWDAKHPLWKEGMYHWGEPEMGYFLSKDEYVIRKDMSMLSDAGVDVLVMDVTNAVRYWSEWDTLFTVMQRMKAEGNKVPKFCFWAFNGPVITVVQELYERIYKENKYSDLWFYWDGKPLLLYNANPAVDATGQPAKNPNTRYDSAAATDRNHPHYGDDEYTEKFFSDYTKEVKNYFTLRNMWWGYYEWAGKRFVGMEDTWSFGYDFSDARVRAMHPDSLVSTHKGMKEEAAVTPAQHPMTLVGKSWTREKGQPELNEYDLPVPTYVPWLKKTVTNPEGYGIYFQDRWEEALKTDPEFLYLNDWNEWTAGKYHPEKGKTSSFMRRESPYFFVDQYNSEFNRCIQPMKDGYTDNYYMQMAQNIRRYKGVRPRPKSTGMSRIKIDGDFSDWKKVSTEYRDTRKDVFHRDHVGYAGLRYKDSSGRNDIVNCKAAVNKDNIAFYAETDEALTAPSGKNWMLLLIDADNNSNTGWYGYDFIINKKIKNNNTTTLMRYEDGAWKEIADLNYRYKENALEFSVPRQLLGLKGDAFTLDFHWSDNPDELKDPISLCTHGDSAPNRRFNYRYDWTK
jgi:hypothetical protein